MSEDVDQADGKITPSNDNQLSFFRQSLQLIAAFRDIADANLRQSIIRVVQDIAEADKKSGFAGLSEDECE